MIRTTEARQADILRGLTTTQVGSWQVKLAQLPTCSHIQSIDEPFLRDRQQLYLLFP